MATPNAIEKMAMRAKATDDLNPVTSAVFGRPMS